MPGSFKRFAERSLVATLPFWRRRGRLRDRVLILAFHNVVSRPADAGLDRSLHLSYESFRELLDAVASSHRFVSLDEVVTGSAGSDARPRIAVSFDDAYVGALRLALPLLAERNIPATVFVAPGRLGAEGLWWDTVSDSNGHGLDSLERDAALDVGRGVEEEVHTLAVSRRWSRKTVSPDARIASFEAFRLALRLPGITIGSHTWSHPNLTRSTDSELTNELNRSYKWLAAEAGPRFRTWLAYPYGLADVRVELAAAAAGYGMGFRIDGCWGVVPPPRPFGTPRLNVPAGLSPDGMRLRGAGLFCR
jgi:peptidoglycan/xylan/chitin deacetylase (PgdA/CDA1 family)